MGVGDFVRGCIAYESKDYRLLWEEANSCVNSRVVGSSLPRGAFADDSPLSQTDGLTEKAGRTILPAFFVYRLSPQDLGTSAGVAQNSRFRERPKGSREEHPDIGSLWAGWGEKLSDSQVNTPLRVTDPFPLGAFRESSNRDRRVNTLCGNEVASASTDDSGLSGHAFYRNCFGCRVGRCDRCAQGIGLVGAQIEVETVADELPEPPRSIRKGLQIDRSEVQVLLGEFLVSSRFTFS